MRNGNLKSAKMFKNPIHFNFTSFRLKREGKKKSKLLDLVTACYQFNEKYFVRGTKSHYKFSHLLFAEQRVRLINLLQVLDFKLVHLLSLHPFYFYYVLLVMVKWLLEGHLFVSECLRISDSDWSVFSNPVPSKVSIFN